MTGYVSSTAYSLTTVPSMLRFSFSVPACMAAASLSDDSTCTTEHSSLSYMKFLWCSSDVVRESLWIRREYYSSTRFTRRFFCRLIIREWTNNLQVYVVVVLVSTYWMMLGVTDGMTLAREAFWTDASVEQFRLLSSVVDMHNINECRLYAECLNFPYEIQS